MPNVDFSQFDHVLSGKRQLKPNDQAPGRYGAEMGLTNLIFKPKKPLIIKGFFVGALRPNFRPAAQTPYFFYICALNELSYYGTSVRNSRIAKCWKVHVV
jgi:hypothetical protein